MNAFELCVNYSFKAMDLDKSTTNYDASDEHMGRISSIYFTIRDVFHSKQVVG